MFNKEKLIDKSLYRVIECDIFSMFKPSIIREYMGGLKYELTYNSNLSENDKRIINDVIIRGEKNL